MTKLKILLVLLLALATLPALIIPSLASADGMCNSGRFCAWPFDDYGGFKQSFTEPFEEWTGFETSVVMNSGKNTFGNRKVLVGDYANNVIRCFDPGQIRPQFPGADKYRIGQSGSEC